MVGWVCLETIIESRMGGLNNIQKTGQETLDGEKRDFFIAFHRGLSNLYASSAMWLEPIPIGKSLFKMYPQCSISNTVSVHPEGNVFATELPKSHRALKCIQKWSLHAYMTSIVPSV